MSKIGILLGAGVGYVLGARAGRERYTQIQQQATKLWKSPKVQEKKEQATEVAGQKGSELQDKVSEKVSEKVDRKDDDGSATDPSPTALSQTSAAFPVALSDEATPYGSAPTDGSQSGPTHV